MTQTCALCGLDLTNLPDFYKLQMSDGAWMCEDCTLESEDMLIQMSNNTYKGEDIIMKKISEAVSMDQLLRDVLFKQLVREIKRRHREGK